jgi:CTP:molybdopterin cytidylyltransferase MocA
MVAGIILAAGRSERMGRPKALLRQVQSGNTFVGHLIRIARESRLDPILVVGRPGADEVAAEVGRAGGTLVVNAGADRGQLSSIVAGLDAADAAGASAIMVLPVDVPLLSTRVLTAVLDAAAADERPIVRAVHRGRHGHPVLFKRAVFSELRAADPLVGARAVVRADPARVNDVEVDHPGVTLDIDTPEEYRRVFGREL